MWNTHEICGKISRVLFLLLFSIEKSAYSLTPPCLSFILRVRIGMRLPLLTKRPPPCLLLPAQDIALSHPLETTLAISSFENLATNSGSCHYFRSRRWSWETQGLFAWWIQLQGHLIFKVKAPYLFRGHPHLRLSVQLVFMTAVPDLEIPLLPSYTAPSFFRYLTSLLS